MDSTIDLAEYLFMRRCSQKEIAARVGRSESAVSEWVKRYGWKEKRAGVRISRHEMVAKLLQRIDDLLSEDSSSIDTTELLRITKSIKTLDKEVGLVDYIDCFMTFGQWMTQHAEHAEAIRETMSSRTDFWENFTKAVNIIQDKYITSLTKDGGQR